jgi:hypothetical protein
MHNRGEVDCSGLQYEGWLIQEARKRNPNIVTYGLSWGVPGWVGNGSYYSTDNIAYQTSWVGCVKETTGESIDYLGLWNEKPQPGEGGGGGGGGAYVLQLKASLLEAGFGSTQIIVMDGGFDVAEFTLAQNNATFAAAVYGAGLHYPCDKPHPEVAEVNWALWASEDYSRDPAWSDGGTYWGKALNQNYVLMNATATISWSLIWSAYTNLVCNGAGLMRAHMPWSGNYEVSAPIFLSAHTTQFADPGYRYLSVSSTGSGQIFGVSGQQAGTWVTLVPPADAPPGLTVIVETLVNDGCIARTYEPVNIFFTVSGASLPAPNTVLHVWRSRRDAYFVQENDITISADGTFSLSLMPDEIITASTRSDATHGSFSVPIPAAAPWPLPFVESFNTYTNGSLPRFFSDQGGAWIVRGEELVQVAWGDPGANGWGSDVDPLTQFGDENWADYNVTSTVRFSTGGPYIKDTGTDGPLILLPCDATSQAQAFVANVPALGYLRNVATSGCIDVNGCGTIVDTYECVDDPAGDSCNGPPGAYPNLQWFYNTTSGHMVSGLGSVLTLAVANGTLYSLPVNTAASSGFNQIWDFNVSSGQISSRGTTPLQCVSTPPKKAYVRVCGRVSSFSGFAGDLSATCLEVTTTGLWSLYAHDGATASILANGILAGSFDPSSLNTLSLSFTGPLVSANINNVQLARVDAGTSAESVGNVLLGAGWHNTAWSNVSVYAA